MSGFVTTGNLPSLSALQFPHLGNRDSHTYLLWAWDSRKVSPPSSLESAADIKGWVLILQFIDLLHNIFRCDQRTSHWRDRGVAQEEESRQERGVWPYMGKVGGNQRNEPPTFRALSGKTEDSRSHQNVWPLSQDKNQRGFLWTREARHLGIATVRKQPALLLLVSDLHPD